MTAPQLIDSLRHRWWVDLLVRRHFPFTAKMTTLPQFELHTEVTVRLPTKERDRFDRLKPQRRRFDAVALIKPHYKAWGADLLTVGFELKSTRSDLLGDTKLSDYLGYTDFMYLVVPNLLTMDAMTVASQFQHEDGTCPIGVIEADTTCEILVPTRQILSEIDQVELYRELCFRPFRKPPK